MKVTTVRGARIELSSEECRNIYNALSQLDIGRVIGGADAARALEDFFNELYRAAIEE